MRGNSKSGLLRDVTGGLLSAMLDDEAAESAKIHRLACDDGLLDAIHRCLEDSLNGGLLQTGGLGHFVYDFCLVMMLICLV